MTTNIEASVELITALKDARSALLRETEGMPETEMTARVSGDWTLKDVLAHLSSWDEMSWLDVERAARGHVPFLLSWKPDENDDWNLFLMRGRRAFSLEQVRAELEDRRHRLFAALESTPSVMEGPLVQRLFHVLIDHDNSHAAEIRQWRQSTGI